MISARDRYDEPIEWFDSQPSSGQGPEMSIIFAFVLLAFVFCLALLSSDRLNLASQGFFPVFILSIVLSAVVVYSMLTILTMFRKLFGTSTRIDHRLSQLLDHTNISKFRVFSKTFPGYRFVDIYQAVERFAKEHKIHNQLDTENALDLNSIINSRFYGAHQAKLSIPTKEPRAVDYHDEQFFPNDQFWVCADSEDRNSGFKAILRVKVNEYTKEIILELAVGGSDQAEDVTETLVQSSIEHSIYRNKLLQVSFDSGIKDEYGDVDQPGQVHLAFKQERTVSRDDIVLDDEIADVVHRNIFDFHAKRDLLKRYGVPGKKGVLFYGPPGTGKTFTCQYIYSTLRPITTLVVTGQSLLQVKSICNLARMLQPSLLVLEDVDLIFTSREINLYSTALGDLMDEMDGFQKDESVMFLLTTNAIERLEEAIKDRPGRINQCIFFGHPNDELRKRYIERYLRGYETTAVDLDEVVRIAKGASQAFIKELIYRAVQVSLEHRESSPIDSAPVTATTGSETSTGNNGQPEGESTEPPLHEVALSTRDFEVAHDEMTRYGERSAGNIMGFRVDH